MRLRPLWLAIPFALFAFALFAFAQSRADQPPIKWLRNLDDAKKVAAAEKKNLLINFTALSWCGACVSLERHVLSQPEFAAAANHFVLVELDYPLPENASDELKEHYETWKREYLIQAYPTIVVADANGLPYAHATSSTTDSPTLFLWRLTACRVARQLRDQQLTFAAGKEGPERAKNLHAAIQAVVPFLDTLKVNEIQNDPVLFHYGPQIDEIRMIDSENTLGLRAIYDTRIDAQAQQRQRDSIFREIAALGGDYARSVAYIDEQLPNVTDSEIRWRLQSTRLSNLEREKKHDAALAYARQMLDDDTLSEAHRDRLCAREAYNLFNLDRAAEGIAVYDRRISSTTAGTRWRYLALEHKAQMLHTWGPVSASIDAWRAVRVETKHGADEWETATALLAMKLEEDEQYAEAIALNQEWMTVLEVRHDAYFAGCLVSIARIQQKAGQNEQARQSLVKAEQHLPKFELARAQDCEEKEYLDGQIKRIRGLIDTPK